MNNPWDKTGINKIEQILPIVREIVTKEPQNMFGGMDIKPKEKVLMVTDSTMDPLVAEAFALAIREAGCHLDVIELEGFPGMRDSLDLVDRMFSNNWYPDWIWEAIRQADIFLQGAFLKVAHTPGLPVDFKKHLKKPRHAELWWTRDLLASSYEIFPSDLRNLIDKKTWEIWKDAKEIRILDEEGTDLTIGLQPEDWTEGLARMTWRGGFSYMPGHLQLPFPLWNIEGVMATSSITFGGPIPLLKLFLKDGRVVSLEGGGRMGEALLESFDRYKDAQFKGFPSTGANWLGTLAIGTNPKASISPLYQDLSGSGRIYAWSFGRLRSGVIHTSVGNAMVRDDYKMIRHICIYSPTIIADGKTYSEKGHLTALDSPEVRELASRYGDPDKLLKEDWNYNPSQYS